MDTHNTSHSRRGSLTQPQPVPISSSPRSSPQASSTSPTSSALSQSLKAFQGLALSPPSSTATQQNPLHSDEFREAFHHVRRASTGAQANQGRPIVINDTATSASTLAPPVPGLSTSPSSSSEAGTSAGSLPTPSSSPTSTAAPALPATNTGKARSVSNGKVGKPSATLGGVCEGPEIAFERGELAIEDDDDAPSPPPALTPPASSSLFAGGARWGWPAAGAGSTGPSPAAIGPRSPPATDSFLQRRGSLSFASAGAASTSAGLSVSPSSSVATIKTTGFAASPPNGASTSSGSPSTSTSPTSDPFKMMQPLGRVVSAGAALQTPSSAEAGGGGGPGFGLFRRFSIGGLGSRKPSQPAPPAPAPPSTTHPAPTLLTPSHSSLTSAPAPPALTTDTKPASNSGTRGRSLAPPGKGGGAKGRKLSPMGERILRGGY
ncbi:Proteophosphoglycan 5 [Rhodotorula toruloides ATCC 204091]|nr:Proteophosphoglycan 5 [Rhodotorula toruloides ATCC 204091]